MKLIDLIGNTPIIELTEILNSCIRPKEWPGIEGLKPLSEPHLPLNSQ